MRIPWKKRWPTTHSDAKTLALLIMISFAAHIALLLLIPPFIASPPEYIEVEMFEGVSSPREDAPDEVDMFAPRIPEETRPVFEGGLDSMAWEGFAPQTANDVRDFEWLTRHESEPVAPDAIPRAERLLAQIAPEKERPIERDAAKGVSLTDDAVKTIPQPPRHAEAQPVAAEREFDVSAPDESAKLPLSAPNAPVVALRESRRAESFASARLPATTFAPDELPELFQAEPPAVSARKALPSERTDIAPPIPTATRNVSDTPAVETDEFRPPSRMTQPRLFAERREIAPIRAMPTARRVLPRIEPRRREPSASPTSSVPDPMIAKAEPHTIDETANVERETPLPEEPIRIEGPAAARNVLYRPPRLPSVTLDRDVTIRLKFWVLPDGTVGEVMPLQRGDIRLEQAAIQYVKSWRFTPVSGSESVWGMIPVTYRLR